MAKNKYDVFISYSQQDESSARKLAEALKSKGFSAWTDTEIRPGKKWADQIEKALRQSKVFLLLISPDFLTSSWTNFELGVALSRAAMTPDTHIIPLTIKHVNHKALPMSLRDLQVINAEDISSSQAAEKVVERLESLPAAT
jgi:hypothetical protein